MAQYIDKDALVAEIERRMQCYSSKGCEPNDGKWVELISIKHFINTLEVKEVDLEKEIDNYFNTSIRKNIRANDNVTLFMQVHKTAKHFFELGFSVSNKA